MSEECFHFTKGAVPSILQLIFLSRNGGADRLAPRAFFAARVDPAQPVTSDLPRLRAGVFRQIRRAAVRGHIRQLADVRGRGALPTLPQISQPATPAGLALDLGEAESRKSMMCCKRRLVSTVAIGAVAGTLARVRVVARTVIFTVLRWASVTLELACNCCTSGRATVSAVAREWSL